MTVQIQTKAVVSVAEMARMVGLSRARFYQLQKAGVFPPPVYSLSNRRPLYVEEQQEVCLQVRRRNCGINGRPVLFYAGRLAPAPRKPKPAKPKRARRGKDVLALVEGLNALGLSAATGSQVEQATKELFPQGTDNLDRAVVLRAVFLHLKKNPANSARR
jgi:hypothetical protein